ncbi:MAG: hypothetical protein O8C61_09970 [Candidatus Methanoperedens sp.]|nr:hypothetical protein [Candidatus Methanoperedens sp.]
MTEVNLEGRIFRDLEFIKAELISIKEHMVDADTFLSEEEKMLVKESFEHEKEGKLLSISDFKKNL